MARKQRKILGRHVVVDPEICHGKPTFLGTRIMVWQVLEQVAEGMTWDAITAEWRGSISKEAIAEAVELAQRTFEEHALDYVRGFLPVTTAEAPPPNSVIAKLRKVRIDARADFAAKSRLGTES